MNVLEESERQIVDELVRKTVKATGSSDRDSANAI
eukprot:gene19989-14564_t